MPILRSPATSRMDSSGVMASERSEKKAGATGRGSTCEDGWIREVDYLPQDKLKLTASESRWGPRGGGPPAAEQATQLHYSS